MNKTVQAKWKAHKSLRLAKMKNSICLTQRRNRDHNLKIRDQGRKGIMKQTKEKVTKIVEDLPKTV